MLFSTLTFLLVFLPFVILVYYIFLRKHRNAQNLFLFLTSLFFYAWGEPWFVLVMLLSIVVNWLFGRLIGKHATAKSKKKFILILACVFNLSIIFIFKYLTFVLTNVTALFHFDMTIPEILLPIGISFFTFQALSYVVDVYRGNGEAQTSLLNVGLYISFFPQLIAGPIVRYETVAREIKERIETREDFTQGICRFILGLGKKILISDTMAQIADTAFHSQTADLSVGLAWLGALAYTLQIFFDFSGYSDMAIGLGRMFGFHFLENFNYPYISTSITEFWRRWHISLGTWFRDYVYFPLGGSRVHTKTRLILNLFIVWFLTGLWHGASWNFIVWGLMYFVLLVIEKLTGLAKTNRLPVLRYIYTIAFVVLGWIFFRSESLHYALSYAKVMLLGAFQEKRELIDSVFLQQLGEGKVFLIVGILCSTPLIPYLAKKLHLQTSRLGAILYPLAYFGLFAICLSYIVKGAYSPFIYFNF